MDRAIPLASLLASLALCGCGAVIHRTDRLDDGAPVVMTIDAKQRFAFVLPRRADPRAGKRSAPTDQIVCAEPSPDTMVGVAASLGLDVPLHFGRVGADTSMAQAVAQIGTRTQTIALLRDGLYRACEAYANGILSEKDYELMLRHYDMTMVMLVAIDGLTRACDAHAAISTNASTSPGAANPSKPASDSGAASDAAAKPAAADKAAAADKPAPDASATGPTRSAANATGTAAQVVSSNCPDPAKVAAEVRTMVTEFFTFKRPLHEMNCIAAAIEPFRPADNAGPQAWAAFERVSAIAIQTCQRVFASTRK